MIRVYQMKDALSLEAKYRAEEISRAKDSESIKELGLQVNKDFYRYRIELSNFDDNIHKDNDFNKRPCIFIDVSILQKMSNFGIRSIFVYIEKWCWNIFSFFEEKEEIELDDKLGRINLPIFLLTLVYCLQYFYIYKNHIQMMALMTLVTYVYFNYVTRIKTKLGYAAALNMLIFYNLGTTFV